MAEVITRFAPSPTGHLHIGGARTALLNWAFARGRSGRFILRIEDTDAARSSEAAAKGILEDLAWLGILWDEGPRFHGSREHTSLEVGGDPRDVGPFYQSQRRHIYEYYYEGLVEQGLAYPAFETAEELEVKRRAAQQAKQTYRYDRAGLNVPRDERLARMRSGEPHVLRLRAPDGPVGVTDQVLGEVNFGPGEIDDFVIRKADGLPTYHFAVVVDDALMGVTHVLRGQEHLMNTPRHVALQRALSLPTPVYAHMPLIFNADGSKMSKRDKDKAARAACRQAGVATLADALVRAGDAPALKSVGEESFGAWLADKTRQLPTDALRELARAINVDLPEIDVDDFRRSGYLPEVLCNYVALLGWNPGGDVEKFDPEFLCERFDLDRIGKSNSKFDRAKLLAFNQDAIAAMDDERFATRWRAWCERFDPSVVEHLGDRFDLAAAAARPRARTLADAREPIAFALIDETRIEYDEKASAKFLLKGEPSGLDVLRRLRDVLAGIEPFQPDAIEAAAKRFSEDIGIGMGKVAQPLRVAMTGAAVSPGLGQTLALVGRAGAVRRIDRCLAHFASTG